MFNSPYHAVPKWLSEMIEPVSKHILQLVDTVEILDMEGIQFFPFHVATLFANILIDKTIKYLSDYTQQNHLNVGYSVSKLKQPILLSTYTVQLKASPLSKYGVVMKSSLDHYLRRFYAKLEDNQIQSSVKQLVLFKCYVDKILHQRRKG